MKEKHFMAFGDVHGHYELMFETAKKWEKDNGKSLTALLCVGDMDPIFCDLRKKFRYDLSCLADYQEQELKSPYPIVMVAGNNDDSFAYQYGEIAPNIHSLGRAGVLNIDDVLIGGISGVYKKEFFEKPVDLELYRGYPWYTYYNINDISQILISQRPKIFLTHDWFKWSVSSNGTKYTSKNLINEIKPKFIFSGHIHNKERTDFSNSQTTIKRLNRVHPLLKNFSYAFSVST